MQGGVGNQLIHLNKNNLPWCKTGIDCDSVDIFCWTAFLYSFIQKLYDLLSHKLLCTH